MHSLIQVTETMVCAFSFDVCRSPIFEAGNLLSGVLSVSQLRHLFTTTKLFHAPGFAWGKSVLRKQVIVFYLKMREA